MKRMMVAGNWKMHNGADQTRKLIEQIIHVAPQSISNSTKAKLVDVVICPPFTSLAVAAELLSDTTIALGAQNCHHANQGAYTGEVSAAMLSEIGCTYVIVGHSERRRDANETDNLIALKAVAACAEGLTPILCIGENLQQREQGKTSDVVSEQVKQFALSAGAECLRSCVIAYEPIWAIGTGIAATPEQAQEVHTLIRTLCEDHFDVNPMILYGGSVTDNNASTFFLQPDIDGALVGGASLNATTFVTIVNAALQSP